MILLFLIIPILRNSLFWAYVWQLKEYRTDRVSDYLWTKQWKSALFNFFNIADFALFLFWFALFHHNLQELFHDIVIWALLFQTFFTFFKLYSRDLRIPKFTTRLILIYAITLIIDFVLISYSNWTVYLPFAILLILFSQSLIFLFWIVITMPLSLHFRQKIVNKAWKKINKMKSVKKIWITWSYWKSSVKEFLYQILSKKYNVIKTPKNNNTPLWISNVILDKMEKTYNYFICEMWAYKKWEITELWNIVNHQYAFLTWINNQHIWLFWNQENIIEWKLEIMKKVLENKWVAYVNFDNEYSKNITFPEPLNLVTYWLDDFWVDALWTIEDINEDWILFKMEYKKEVYEFQVNVIWKHNVSNLIWVIAFCLDQWVKFEIIKSVLENIKLYSWNFNIIKKEDDLLFIDDTYNINTTWTVAATETLDLFKFYKKILVLDDILELWWKSEKIHFKLWQNIWKRDITEIFLIWKNYSDSVKKWLLDSWFKWKIETTFEYEDKWKTIILFEWRGAKKYLDKLNNEL